MYETMRNYILIANFWATVASMNKKMDSMGSDSEIESFLDD